MQRLVLIDTLALAYKAYFAFIRNPLRTKTGEPTSAVFGFVNQFIKILEDLKPDYIAAAFDSKEKTIRHEMFPLYKSNRSEMPDDMVPQIARIRQVIESFSVKTLINPGYEADDIIGTIAKKYASSEIEVLCVTPDKDYIQLLEGNIKLIKPGKSTEEIDIITYEKAQESYGFAPELMIDYLAILGDKSDFIPGVKGIGEVGALELISKFGSLENIYSNLDIVEKKSIRDKLIADRDNAFLSKKLATIILDVPFEISLDELKFSGVEFNEIVPLFEELEFKNSILRVRKLFSAGDGDFADTESEEIRRHNSSAVKYILVENELQFEELVEILKKSAEFAFDTETNSEVAYSAVLAGISFCVKEKTAYYVPVLGNGINKGVSLEKIKQQLTPVFADPGLKKICQNAKYDIAVLRNVGIEVNGLGFDTMLASYLIDPDQKHGMDELSRKYLNYSPIPITSILGEKIDANKIFSADLNELAVYSAEDSDVTYRLYKTFIGILKKNNLDKLAYSIEFPLVTVLEDMERTGIRIDQDSLRALSKELEKQADEITKNIHNVAGEIFNINSNQQLQKILFEKLNLPKTKKTKTGFSTDAQALEGLKGEHVIIDFILNYRQLTKLKSTYTDSLPNLINPKTGKVHTSYNQTVAATGRLSSQNPNLQNIPVRTDLGKEIRRSFVPSDDNHLLLSADYSQIELRILASICEDKGLTSAFENGEDIHRSTAALVFSVPPAEVTPDMRRKAKEVNFGILYGIGAFGLKTRLGINQQHAKEIIDTYFSAFNKVKGYMDNSISFARSKGYSETMLGRRRYLRNINSSNFVVRQFEERVAINMPIQGTAADMIKIAMINVFNEMQKRQLKSKMILQVHDELVFDTVIDELDELKELVVNGMQNALPLKVPVIVDTGTGKNWLDAH
ncbi:MAG: DNA polymerase I [Ignavibacteriaceae bacterium]|nr:DNA polymerase I [Ignavibacteriaceae bacterium]